MTIMLTFYIGLINLGLRQINLNILHIRFTAKNVHDKIFIGVL